MLYFSIFRLKILPSFRFSLLDTKIALVLWFDTLNIWNTIYVVKHICCFSSENVNGVGDCVVQIVSVCIEFNFVHVKPWIEINSLCVCVCMWLCVFACMWVPKRDLINARASTLLGLLARFFFSVSFWRKNWRKGLKRRKGFCFRFLLPIGRG